MIDEQQMYINAENAIFLKMEKECKIKPDVFTPILLNRIEALEAALTEAHRVILHELDNGRTPYLLPVDNGGKGLGYFEDVLAGINR